MDGWTDSSMAWMVEWRFSLGWWWRWWIVWCIAGIYGCLASHTATVERWLGSICYACLPAVPPNQVLFSRWCHFGGFHLNTNYYCTILYIWIHIWEFIYFSTIVIVIIHCKIWNSMHVRKLVPLRCRSSVRPSVCSYMFLRCCSWVVSRRVTTVTGWR